MNAIPDHSALTSFSVDWDAIYAAVNAWSGECMHHFSAVELAVTKTLLALSQASPDPSAIGLRHFIGQRLEDLAEAIGPDGPFADAGKSASTCLAEYRERHEAFRRQLCHGLVVVTVAQNGHWMMVLRTLSIRARQGEEREIVIEQSAAASRLVQLKRDGQKLAALLGQVRKAAEKT